jgi:hypothetical protein
VTQRQRRRRLTRDGLLFTLGAGGFLHELLVTQGERPTLLLACFALMGVPLFLRADEKRKGDDG